VDLPALDLPTKAISGKSCAGKNSSLGAVVRNLAVCNQPISCLSVKGAAGAVGKGAIGSAILDAAVEVEVSVMGHCKMLSC
jgi:hypothetical protein